MNKLIASTVLPLLFAASAAIAGEMFDGFAIGVSGAQADIDVNDTNVKVDGDASGYRLFGRYRFTDNFGIEAGWSAFDRPDDPTLPSNLEVENDAIDLFATGTLPLTDKLDVFGKAGLQRWHTETEEDELTEYSTHSIDLALGLGGEYQLNDRIAIRSEFLWSEGQNSGGMRSLSLSGVYEF